MTNPDRHRIFSQLTQTRFFHIEDSLAQGKLRFFIGSFERGQGSNNTAYAFLDVDDARVIMSDLSWGRPVTFTDYKGGKDSIGALISRVLKFQRKEDKVWIEVQNGVGEELPGGAIKPRGEPHTVISIPLTIHQSRKMAFACLAYIHAWDVARLLKGDQVSAVSLYRQTGSLR